VLPVNAKLTSVGFEFNEAFDSQGSGRLVLDGLLRAAPGQDRMQGIMALVAALHADSVLAAQYRTIRLVESRTGGEAVAPAEFRIECR
jgi:hypothetical protein